MKEDVIPSVSKVDENAFSSSQSVGKNDTLLNYESQRDKDLLSLEIPKATKETSRAQSLQSLICVNQSRHANIRSHQLALIWHKIIQKKEKSIETVNHYCWRLWEDVKLSWMHYTKILVYMKPVERGDHDANLGREPGSEQRYSKWSTTRSANG